MMDGHHVPGRGGPQRCLARHCVVEPTLAWLSKWRGLLTR
jgi:hypothetical protein